MLILILNYLLFGEKFLHDPFLEPFSFDGNDLLLFTRETVISWPSIWPPSIYLRALSASSDFSKTIKAEPRLS